MEVLGIDHSVEGLVAAALKLPCGYESRVDGISEFGDYNQVFDRTACCLGRGVGKPLMDKIGHSPASRPDNAVNAPQAGVNAMRVLARLGQEPDLVAPAHGPIGKLDGLRDVALEVQTERVTPRQRFDLVSQVGSELRVQELHLAKQTA